MISDKEGKTRELKLIKEVFSHDFPKGTKEMFKAFKRGFIHGRNW